MKFVAKQPREGINVSKTHPLAEAGTLVIGLTAIALVIVFVLVFIVELSLYFVPEEKEAALFSGWMPEDLIALDGEDSRTQELQALVDRLAVHWPETSYRFRMEVDDSSLANAAALPGGLIVVTRGLLEQVESENELAFVLGHELGHFKNRDHLRAMGRGVVLSLFFASVTNSDVAGIGINVADLTLRGFSRRQESEADRFSLALVNREYGHVNEAWRLFERWDEAGHTPSNLSGYLSTHPDPGSRVADLRKIAMLEGWSSAGVVTPLQWSQFGQREPDTM